MEEAASRMRRAVVAYNLYMFLVAGKSDHAEDSTLNHQSTSDACTPWELVQLLFCFNLSLCILSGSAAQAVWAGQGYLLKASTCLEPCSFRQADSVN